MAKAPTKPTAGLTETNTPLHKLRAMGQKIDPSKAPGGNGPKTPA